MAATSAPTEFGVFVRLPLTPPLVEKYQVEAQNYGVSLEELLANRLSECADYNATKPLYFNDSQRRDMEALLGKNVSKPGDVLVVLRKALAIKINGVSILLKPDVLERLRTRHHSGDFSEWLGVLVTQELEKYCGLR